MISALYRFDREVLAKLTDTHFIHMWSFNNIYEWQTGKVLPIVLNDIAQGSPSLAPNHLGSAERNLQVANMLIEIIDSELAKILKT